MPNRLTPLYFKIHYKKENYLKVNAAYISRLCRTEGTLVKNGQAKKGKAKQLALQGQRQLDFRVLP